MMEEGFMNRNTSIRRRRRRPVKHKVPMRVVMVDRPCRCEVSSPRLTRRRADGVLEYLIPQELEWHPQRYGGQVT